MTLWRTRLTGLLLLSDLPHKSLEIGAVFPLPDLCYHISSFKPPLIAHETRVTKAVKKKRKKRQPRQEGERDLKHHHCRKLRNDGNVSSVSQYNANSLMESSALDE